MPARPAGGGIAEIKTFAARFGLNLAGPPAGSGGAPCRALSRPVAVGRGLSGRGSLSVWQKACAREEPVVLLLVEPGAFDVEELHGTRMVSASA